MAAFAAYTATAPMDTKPLTVAPPKGQPLSSAHLLLFIFGGNATFTVVSKRTQERITLKVQRAKGTSDGRPWFVSVLRGADNSTDYTFMGSVFPGELKYQHSRKSLIGRSATSTKVAQWLFFQLGGAADQIDQAEIWHEGSCGRCGRKLTVPSSIRTGLGPVCATRGGL